MSQYYVQRSFSLAWSLRSSHYCNDQQKGQARSHLFRQNYYNPGQNVLGHLRKLDKKTHFAKLTHILPLKKAVGCCYKGLFLLSPSPPSSVDCVEY